MYLPLRGLRGNLTLALCHEQAAEASCMYLAASTENSQLRGRGLKQTNEIMRVKGMADLQGAQMKLHYDELYKRGVLTCMQCCI